MKLNQVNFFVEESNEMIPREILMRRVVIGWVNGIHCGTSNIC